MKNYLKNNLKTYVNSFKNRKIPIVLLINTIFILITTLIIKLIKLISQPQIEKIDRIDLSSLVSQTEAQLQSTAEALKGFALFAIFTAIIFTLLLIVNWSLFQGIIYNLMLKKKLSLKYLNKFLLLNIIWLIPWLVLIIILLFGGKTQNFIVPTIILFLLFFHFSLILYPLFAKNNKLSQIKQALKLGATKFHHFIIPYITIIITFIIISQLNLLNINYMLLTLVYLLFFSWIQSYIKDIALNITNIYK